MTLDNFPKLITKSVFAKILGVTPSAITSAIKSGDVQVNHIGLIDIGTAVNMRYAKECRARKKNTAKGQSEEKNKLKTEKRGRGRPPGRKSQNIRKPAQPPAKPSPNPFPPNNQDLDAEDAFKADYQIAKLKAQTKAIEIKNAISLKMFIDREFVDQVIGRIGSILSNHMLTMGDRLAAECAAECGALNPESKIAVKQIIDKDVTRSINALKMEIQRQYEDKVDEIGK